MSTRTFSLTLPGPEDPRLELRGCPISLDVCEPSDFWRHGLPFPEALTRTSARRRAECLAGRVAAAAALDALSATSREVAIGPDRAPCWPDGFAGSISHDRELAVAAVSRCSTNIRIGVDCEAVFDHHLADDVAAQVATDSELDAWVPVLPCRRHALTVVFSAKESLYKAVYPMLANADFLDAAILPGPGCDSLRAVMRDGRSWQGRWMLVQPARVITLFILEMSSPCLFIRP